MKTRVEKITEFFKNLDSNIDVLNYIDPESVESYDDVFKQISENDGFVIEIIYYSNAIKYLQENDPSLMESFEIAKEHGLDLYKLNSESLASMHASVNSINLFSDLADEIDEFFDNLN
jgi:intracellular sulfur oxidation DsrE/DsrF family protein